MGSSVSKPLTAAQKQRHRSSLLGRPSGLLGLRMVDAAPALSCPGFIQDVSVEMPCLQRLPLLSVVYRSFTFFWRGGGEAVLSCGFDCAGTRSVDLTPASAVQVLGLKRTSRTRSFDTPPLDSVSASLLRSRTSLVQHTIWKVP